MILGLSKLGITEFIYNPTVLRVPIDLPPLEETMHPFRRTP